MENLETYTISKKQYISVYDLMKQNIPKFKCKNGRRFITKFKLTDKDYIYAKSKSGQWIQSAGISYRHDKVFLTTAWVSAFLSKHIVAPTVTHLIELEPTILNINGSTITNYTINGIKWFIINDILKFLKYKDIKSTRKSISKKFVVQFKHLSELHKDIKFMHAENIHPNTLFINEAGLIYLLSRSRRPNIHEICNGFGIIVDNKFKSNLITTLNEFCNAAGIKSEQNFKVPKTKFVVDYYLPEHKLAIDLNESNNEKFIEKRLGCKFILCNPNDKNLSAIKLLGQIYKAITD